MSDCAHARLERDFKSPGCWCSMCENDGYRILDCSDCGATVLREGAELFEDRWTESPWWYDVEVDDSTPSMTPEEFNAMMHEALTLPLIQIKRGGIKWPTS